MNDRSREIPTAATASGVADGGDVADFVALLKPRVMSLVVFTAFAAGRLVPLQQMGFGLAVAVFLDATIVRSVLVPSTMKLLGDRNWYLPKWLQWLPDLNIEGHEPPQQTETSDAPAELVGVAEAAERDS